MAPNRLLLPSTGDIKRQNCKPANDHSGDLKDMPENGLLENMRKKSSNCIAIIHLV